LANDVYRTPDDRFAGLPDFPFAPHYVEIDELRTHYLDEGRGEPMLLLHGEPTWSFLYRRMIPALRARFRCIAPDYIGFGRSDKLMKVGSYSFAFHYERLERFADALEHMAKHQQPVVPRVTLGPLGVRHIVGRHLVTDAQKCQLRVWQRQPFTLQVRTRATCERRADTVADAAAAGVQHHPDAPIN